MRNYFISILILFNIFLGFTQQNMPKGKNIIDNKRLKNLKTNSEFGKVEIINNTTFKITTISQPKFIYNCATAIPIIPENIEKERVLLFSFMAKTETASLETGEAKLNVLFKQSDSYKNNIVSTQSISSDWKTYFIPFKTDINVSKTDVSLVLHFGFRPQSFLIKDLKFEIFDKGVPLKSLPKTEIKYFGMEADAAWRKAAENRIEAIRKGDFKITFVKDGKPIADKEISIELIEHHFRFGAAISAKTILENETYYNIFKNSFNHAVFENDLKIKSWESEIKREKTIKALEKLYNDKLSVKGHVLIWPGFNYLTANIKSNKNNPKKVEEIIKNHLNSILNKTQGKINNWDVVNEAYTNKDLQKITGSEEILFDGFRTLKSKQPKVKAYTNEYGIISKGGLDTKKQQWYYNFVKRIDSVTNGLIDGIGIQSHIGSDLTPPKKVIELLSYYATLGKQISISEFTMDIIDENLREQYTKDFLTASFSHPNVSEFLFWGFQQDQRNKVDIFKNDWTLGSMGKAYFSLVHDRWKTRINKKLSEEGSIKGRGFYGTYKYSFKISDDQIVSGEFNLLPRSKNVFTVEL